MKQQFSLIFLISFSLHLSAQNTIQEFYALFSKEYTQMQNDEISMGVDTIIDAANAYIRIQRKPNDCCHDYIVFTYFKTQAGEKVFALEKGYGTTASDDFSTVFYSYTNKKWKIITQQVFPFSFAFKDFWQRKTLPAKKFQKCKVNIELPKKGTNVTVRIFPVDLYMYDSIFPKEKDATTYDELFSMHNYENHFYTLEYAWHAQTGKFVLRQKVKKSKFRN